MNRLEWRQTHRDARYWAAWDAANVAHNRNLSDEQTEREYRDQLHNRLVDQFAWERQRAPRPFRGSQGYMAVKLQQATDLYQRLVAYSRDMYPDERTQAIWQCRCFVEASMLARLGLGA